jgi:uncharacterized protein (TIGR02270 family)
VPTCISSALKTDPPLEARPGVITELVEEHAEEASFLWLQRAVAVDAPNYSPQQFADLDERLEAHIDGLRVAKGEGWKLAEAGLDNEGAEDFFPAGVLAVEAMDGRFADVVDRAEHAPEVVPGLISALGWVGPEFLSGRVKDLLLAPSSFQQMLGVAACALHRRDPGSALDTFVDAGAAAVRSRALRAAGELGRVDLLPHVMTAMTDRKQDARYWATWSAVMLGDRRMALEALVSSALKPGVRQMRSLRLALQTMDMERGHELLQQLTGVADVERLRIIGAGLVGHVRYVPWLIEQMVNPTLARIAAEAFVNITGADFNLDQLEAMPPADFEDGPTDDPADEDVEVPEDVALPWPDVDRVKQWWTKNSARFSSSTRYFLRQPVNEAACTTVLRDGFQRQRVLAAHHLSLLSPGTPLFNTSAPAWRQQRMLSKMGSGVI